MQQRNKWMIEKNNAKIKHLELLIEENLPPYKLALGKIIKIYFGDDKKIFVIGAKSQHNICKRAISKICVLPMPDE